MNRRGFLGAAVAGTVSAVLAVLGLGHKKRDGDDVGQGVASVIARDKISEVKKRIAAIGADPTFGMVSKYNPPMPPNEIRKWFMRMLSGNIAIADLLNFSAGRIRARYKELRKQFGSITHQQAYQLAVLEEAEFVGLMD